MQSRRLKTTDTHARTTWTLLSSSNCGASFTSWVARLDGQRADRSVGQSHGSSSSARDNRDRPHRSYASTASTTWPQPSVSTARCRLLHQRACRFLTSSMAPADLALKRSCLLVLQCAALHSDRCCSDCIRIVDVFPIAFGFFCLYRRLSCLVYTPSTPVSRHDRCSR